MIGKNICWCDGIMNNGITRITSTSNRIIKQLRELAQKKGRIRHSSFIIEGMKLVEEAMMYGVPVRYLVAAESSYTEFERIFAARESVPVYLVPDALFETVSTTETPQGVLAVAPLLEYNEHEVISGGSRYVILEQLQDPGNMGTIIRTADACGFDGVLLSSGCADLHNPKVIRSAMGSVFHIPVVSCRDIYDTIYVLKKRGIRVVAAHTRDSEDVWNLPLSDRIAIVIGNEGNGLTQRMLDAVDRRGMIPMPGQAESLNAASAAAMILYESLRQRMTGMWQESPR